MPRYILIEEHSGYIWGDTAALPEFANTEQTPIDAARVLNESLGEYDREYKQVFPHEIMGQGGYLVYEADDDFPIVCDGQDRGEIDAVESTCRLVCAIRVFEADSFTVDYSDSADEARE